jgi:hypothetical protein
LIFNAALRRCGSGPSSASITSELICAPPTELTRSGSQRLTRFFHRPAGFQQWQVQRVSDPFLLKISRHDHAAWAGFRPDMRRL